MRVLLVGNGFDRKLGLKTDYISFLDWMQEQGYGVGEKFAQYSKKLHFPHLETGSRIEEYKQFGRSIQFEEEKFNILNPTHLNNFDESKESHLANSLLYVLPEITSKNISAIRKHPNIWYSFIQLLRYQKKDKLLEINTARFERFLCDEGNWVDIEGLIQKSIETRTLQERFSGGIFSISSHFDVFSLANLLSMDLNQSRQWPKEEIYKLVWEDFLEFKKALCNYLTPLSEKLQKNWSFFETASIREYQKSNQKTNIIRTSDYEKIINFNYTPFLCESSQLYHVHGNKEDRDSIVFGLDMNIKGGALEKDERKTTFELGLTKNKQLLQFSKISQLLHLQVDKISHPLNKISQLSIVGHSIGEQDYSYYFSILDRNVDNIEIICLWYEFIDGGSNKEFMKIALFEMLTAYERYANQRILHKMIFESRIKFKEVFIPKIVLD